MGRSDAHPVLETKLQPCGHEPLVVQNQKLRLLPHGELRSRPGAARQARQMVENGHMATTPRHHLVPQFLLRRFADAEGKLAMVKRENLNVQIPTTVNNACNEAGFYRLETEDIEPDYREGHDPEAVEKGLAMFEARAERSIRSLLEGSPPWSDEDRYNLANLVALQYSRGWRFRTQINELVTLSMRRQVLADRSGSEVAARRFLQQRDKQPTQAAIDKLIDEAYGPQGPRLVVGKPHAVQASFRFAWDVLAPMLFLRPLRLLHFTDDTPLLTSDNPVVTWAPNRPNDRIVALADAITIILPIGPNLALSFATKGDDAVTTAGATRARQINTATEDGAERWIYHHPNMSPLKGLAIPFERPSWRDEKIAVRVDEDGNHRELWVTVQR